MSWTTASLELNDNQARIRSIDLNGLSVRGDQNYIYWSQLNTEIIWITTVFSFSFFFIPSSWRVFHLIYPPLDHLHPPPIDHPNPYLSTCPIRHPLWFFVSCGSQGSTVQRSSPHKGGQKNSCSAFNMVVAAFP